MVEAVNQRKNEARKMNQLINLPPSPIIDNYVIEYDNLLKQNENSKLESESDIRHLENNIDPSDELLEINRLFNSETVGKIDKLPF